MQAYPLESIDGFFQEYPFLNWDAMQYMPRRTTTALCLWKLYNWSVVQFRKVSWAQSNIILALVQFVCYGPSFLVSRIISTRFEIFINKKSANRLLFWFLGSNLWVTPHGTLLIMVSLTKTIFFEQTFSDICILLKITNVRYNIEMMIFQPPPHVRWLTPSPPCFVFA